MKIFELCSLPETIYGGVAFYPENDKDKQLLLEFSKKTKDNRFNCRINRCTLNESGKCNFIKNISWTDTLNCPNPEVYQNLIKDMKKDHKADAKQIGFVGITDIPLYEVECYKCHGKINTSNPKEKNYCLDHKPIHLFNLPTRCD